MGQRIIGRCWCGIINRQGHTGVSLAACDDDFTRSCRIAKGVFDQVINQLPDPVSIALRNQGIIKAAGEPQVGLQGAQGHAVCRILRDLGQIRWRNCRNDHADPQFTHRCRYANRPWYSCQSWHRAGRCADLC
jgi:hypothetical protein